MARYKGWGVTDKDTEKKGYVDLTMASRSVLEKALEGGKIPPAIPRGVSILLSRYRGKAFIFDPDMLLRGKMDAVMKAVRDELVGWMSEYYQDEADMPGPDSDPSDIEDWNTWSKDMEDLEKNWLKRVKYRAVRGRKGMGWAISAKM